MDDITFKEDDQVVVAARVLEVGENSQGELAYRIAFPNGHHFWIDAEHVELAPANDVA